MKKLFTFLFLSGIVVCNAQSWVTTGTAGFSAGQASFTSLAFNGPTPYVAYYDQSSFKATVKKFDGTGWSNVGAANISVGQGFYNAMAFNGTVPYTAYSDNSYSSKACVKSFDGSNWVAVGTLGFSAGAVAYNSFAFAGTSPYLAYQDGANSSKATVMKFDGTTWVNVGAAGFSAGQANYTSLAFNGTTPYVAYVDITNGTKATVMKFDGTNWVLVGTAGFSAGQVNYTSLAFMGSTPYVAYRDVANGNKVTVMKFDGTNWVLVGTAGFSGGSCNYVNLVMNSSIPYVVYRDDFSGAALTVKKFDGTNWVTVGTVNFPAGGGTCNYGSLAFSGSTPCVAFQDGNNGSKATVMQFGTSATGLNFDGINDKISVATPTVPLGNSAYTIEAWIKPQDPSVPHGIVGWGNYGNFNEVNAFRTRTTAEGVGLVNYWWGNDLYATAGFNLFDGNWHHVAVTYDGVDRKIYVDGVVRAQDVPSATTHAVPATNFNVGSTNNGEYFNGGMDEVRIWNRALAASEIQNTMSCEMNPTGQTGLQLLYGFNQGFVGASNLTVTSATDASGNSNNGTLNNFSLAGTTSNWIAGYATGTCPAPATGLNFDGIDDRVQLPAPIVGNLTNFTVEAWVKWNGTTNSAIYSEGYTGSLNQMFSLIPDLGNAGKFEIVLRNAAGTGMVVQYSTGAVAVNAWTHVAFTRTSATTAKLYINGVNTDNFTFADPGTFPLNVANIGVRQRSSLDSYFGGSIDEVRIWNRTLCQQEIQNNMNTQLNAAAQSGLKAYYKFNHGNIGVNNAGITTAVDSSGNSSNGTLVGFALTGAVSNWDAGNATGTATTYIPSTLAGTTGGAQVVQTGNVTATGTYFIENGCGLIAKVLPSGVTPVTGNIASKVKIEATVLTYNGYPYLQRHYDIEPVTNAANATATVTLYYTQAEFTAYNAARGALPALPTSAADASGIANMRITQYHGTGTAPGNYTGSALMIDPVNSNIIYNSTLSRWEVTIDVSGFSGFYAHTNLTAGPLPLNLLSFTGKNNGSTKLLEWSTSNEINIKAFVLERSTDNSNFKDVVTVAGKGAITNAYSYNDNYNMDGTVYYRLRIIDNGGRITYSNTISLNNRETTTINIFPNPVADKATLQVTDKKLVGTTAIIVDAAGKIMETFIINSNVVTIDMSRLSAGLYFLQTINGDTLKMVKK